ncbi:MAG: conjugal transfer protein [Streptococcus orisratti]|uniref:TcpE family conjugal transfer membrane protein n=1 Tax=Streptococcus orisratti TaxID=114652 RepID=UPI00235710CB|nr:TcpE family conjugal transfer membrane protein [Streptococcus orisratti]MCI7677219.1 conjugal transfer protein [Streptococcus orisratti]MDY5635316.1 TcpE family conjugal transfer membrane protein [Streptococcus orisratti]
MEEELFDYSMGINAPYWIQEIKTPKGKQIWYFSTPMQVSFFVVLFLVLFLMLQFLSPLMSWLASHTHSISSLLYFVVPYNIAKYYTETEPDGKKMHVFIADWLKYMFEYGLDKRAIYQGERVEIEEEFVFEKTNL